MKSLDEIMSGEGGAMPESEEQNPAIETPPAPVSEAAPAAEQQPEGEAHEGEQSGMVPVGALHAERAKGRKYTEELAETRRALDELRSMVLRQQQPPQPTQPQAPAEVPDWYADPDKAFQHHASQVIDPVRQALDFNARLTAEAIHKPETVKEALDEFNRLASQGAHDPEIHRRIMSSPNPYHAAVQWHQQSKRQQQFSRFGDDPEAAIEAEVARRLAERTGQPAQQSSQPTPNQAMPSSFAAGRNAGPRAAPQWSGPKPLSEIMGGR